ncbi:hypothetical protein [Paenibacillus alvei]|uniref:hypothetical protein n=1 Tax=Paenibacillus alvei TaxID=44250 RepID=UPI0022819987|nr:hypothetical protein [Paenibacillus alvei]MCY7486729.1 hypothetical protein [Paenibacillus alvei]
MAKPADIQGVLMGDLYRGDQPQIADVKQVLDTLKERVQPLTPVQIQAIQYLKHLQSRPIHNGKKPYEDTIKAIEDGAPKVAPPGFFIRVIEALIPRTQYIDGKSYEKMKSESDGER